MSGLFGTTPADRSATGLDDHRLRRVLRQIVLSSKLGLRSRVRVVGDQAELACEAFARLGMDASCGDAADDRAPCDAAILLEWGSTEPGERSLLSFAALHRSSALLKTVRPGGTLVVIGRFDQVGKAHEAACFARHVRELGRPPQLKVIPDGLINRFFGFRKSAGTAIAFCRQSKQVAMPVSLSPTNAISLPTCCAWAAQPARKPQAA